MANKELTYEEVWKKLSKVDVSKHTEEKMKLTYLSWSRMWNLLMQNYPQAQYEFVDFDGVPYKTLPDGTTEVITRITIDNLVREMRLPVMDYKNNPVVDPTVENYDLAWADLWTENAMEWINQHDTREELTDYYKKNLKSISVLQSDFPEHGNKLIEFFKGRVEEIELIIETKEKEQKNV